VEIWGQSPLKTSQVYRHNLQLQLTNAFFKQYKPLNTGSVQSVLTPPTQFATTQPHPPHPTPPPKLFEFLQIRRPTSLSSLLPCDAMRCTVLVIVIQSVCLSVTLVDCVHMVRPTIVISLPYGSPIILVSGDITLIPKFEGSYPERGR